MKKITLYLYTLCLLLTVYSAQATNTAVSAKTVQTEQAEKMVSRLHQIKEMDKSDLTADDKKQLRCEVLSIQKQLKPLDGDIYISVGGLIIIILLLILIF